MRVKKTLASLLATSMVVTPCFTGIPFVDVGVPMTVYAADNEGAYLKNASASTTIKLKKLEDNEDSAKKC